MSGCHCKAFQQKGLRFRVQGTQVHLPAQLGALASRLDEGKDQHEEATELILAAAGDNLITALRGARIQGGLI